MREVERWSVLELEFKGKAFGSPFEDYEIKAEFSKEGKTVTVTGFYDGEGVYKIRFMPSEEGIYEYRVFGSCFNEDTQEKEGTFLAVPPYSPNNHGPVRTCGSRFIYEDGTPYHCMGTTCYAWVHQDEDRQDQTLKTLEHSCFNKIRFCLFPKYYQYNLKEPLTYPYVRGKTDGQDWDRVKNTVRRSFHTKEPVAEVRDFNCHVFNVEHFRRFDMRIQQLMELGIEADLILFHPYDKWGFSTMTEECNELYLKYAAARYGAYRNVWWSMANEYDLMKWPSEDWRKLAQLVGDSTPYRKMCSIHNCIVRYDYQEEWVTHCSMQRIDLYKHVENTDTYIDTYKKPVVWDEIAYEGNIDKGWGNISGQEMVRRFWETVLRGGYPGHGETFVNQEEIFWWSHGGVLHGESEPRIRFLKEIWDDVPGGALKKGDCEYDELVGIPVSEFKAKNPVTGKRNWCSYELYYYGFGRPSFRWFELPENEKYRIDVIDTWNMTIKTAGVFSGSTCLQLPGKEYIAVRLRKV